jgi:hypothetical protein
MNPDFRHRALALPLVLWSIAFLGGLVVLLAGVVGDWMESESRAERRFVARQMALSGIALGLNPALKPGDPLLRSGSPDGEGYEVRIGNEAALINPNFFVQLGDRPVFQKLFAAWGVETIAAETAIDSLIDWIDADDFLALKGAERGEYERAGRPGYPANRPIRHIRELEAVMNLAPILAAKEDWKNYFTVWYSGRISIQHAKEPVLKELAGLTPIQIESLLKLRAGLDGIEGTDDDQKIASIDSIADFLGADGRQREALAAFFDTTGDIRRIESTGHCYGVRHRIVVVAPAGSPGQIMSWEEK